MDYLIAPTLFQNKACKLPGIGTLSVITNSAEADLHNKRINAPFSSIIFSVSQDDNDVFNEFTALSELIKKDLSEKGKVNLKGVGDFIKTEEGNISFIPVRLNQRFNPPVVADIVIRQNKEHAMLVGDKETTNSEMNDYFEEDEKLKLGWWTWVIILGLTGIGLLVYYFAVYGFNLLGNISGI